MEDNRWTKGSPEGKRQGQPKVKWEKEVEGVMKQRNLISDDAVNRQLWPLKNSNRWTTGKKERKKTDRFTQTVLGEFNFLYNIFPCPTAVTLF